MYNAIQTAADFDENYGPLRVSMYVIVSKVGAWNVRRIDRSSLMSLTAAV